MASICCLISLIRVKFEAIVFFILSFLYNSTTKLYNKNIRGKSLNSAPILFETNSWSLSKIVRLNFWFLLESSTLISSSLSVKIWSDSYRLNLISSSYITIIFINLSNCNIFYIYMLSIKLFNLIISGIRFTQKS